MLWTYQKQHLPALPVRIGLAPYIGQGQCRVICKVTAIRRFFQTHKINVCRSITVLPQGMVTEKGVAPDGAAPQTYINLNMCSLRCRVDQNSALPGVRGKGMTSRMLVMPVTKSTRRSNPRPKPECGTVP